MSHPGRRKGSKPKPDKINQRQLIPSAPSCMAAWQASNRPLPNCGFLPEFPRSLAVFSRRDRRAAGASCGCGCSNKAAVPLPGHHQHQRKPARRSAHPDPPRDTLAKRQHGPALDGLGFPPNREALQKDHGLPRSVGLGSYPQPCRRSQPSTGSGTCSTALKKLTDQISLVQNLRLAPHRRSPVQRSTFFVAPEFIQSRARAERSDERNSLRKSLSRTAVPASAVRGATCPAISTSPIRRAWHR